MRFPVMTMAMGLLLLGGFAMRGGDEKTAAGRPEKTVFAHYMVCFGSPLEFYKREIELAQRHGIDGFALNCGEWLKPDGTPTHYVASAERIFQAAKELNTGFKLVMSPDFACEGINKQAVQNLSDMLIRFYEHPNLFRQNGVAVLSGYAGSQEQYAEASATLKQKGYKFLLVPKTSDNGRHAMAWSFETVIRQLAPQSHIDGLFNFTCDGTVNDLVRSNAMGRRGTLFLDKIFMAGVCPAYNSPNLRDLQGLRGYATMWEGLIRDGADWVEIVTWNDYMEDSNIMPFQWEGYKPQFNRDEACLDATAYYAAWFKTGTPPEITQDRLYLSYRSRGRDQTQVWDVKQKKWVDIRLCEWPYEQIHDDVQDRVYVTAFLKDDATLQCAVGGSVSSVKLRRGVSHADFPVAPGAPALKLERGGKTILEVDGRKQIIEKPDELNSVKGARLAYRTWISGSVVGDGVKLSAADAGMIAEGASASFKLPLVKTGTYNIRITYSNPGTTESRLTLVANGSPDEGKPGHGKLPYCIPAFFPATKEKEFKTVSFMWSLYDKTNVLEVASVRSGTPENAATGADDHGSVSVRQIEIVPVEPFKTASTRRASPEVVEIPGGSFTMGSQGNNPDEEPPHGVTVSSFGLGKYEVTNEEFEQFMPAHRSYRDGYSWRDREPVIYVSWSDAAKYCNWLSVKHGLTPAFDEKTWEFNAGADGFRLPTEAEWEYAASGRGENRLYPWGNAEPAAGLQGNFELKKTLDATARLRSSFEAGVAVVGSYPEGASRDGVMDMAGNVSEWCADYYGLYGAEKQTDPCCQTRSHHRVIRGGSWGYYNMSQRCQDREFNNPGYPGYIYLGLRVAISGKGLEKLRSAVKGK